MSGTLDDGTAGLLAIKRRGGLAVVQDPANALYPDMPRHAIEHAPVDYTVPASVMAPLLVQLVDSPAPDPSSFPVPEQMAIESNLSNTSCGRRCARCREA